MGGNEACQSKDDAEYGMGFIRSGIRLLKRSYMPSFHPYFALPPFRHYNTSSHNIMTTIDFYLLGESTASSKALDVEAGTTLEDLRSLIAAHFAIVEPEGELQDP